MRLTIIPSDKSVIIEGVGQEVDSLIAPENIHALQWYDTRGQIELTNMEVQEITTLPEWANQAVTEYNKIVNTNNNNSALYDDGILFVDNLHIQYPKASRKSIYEILQKDFQNIQLTPLIRKTDNNIIGLYSDYMIGVEGLASFREIMKMTRKLGVPIFSNPYPQDETTYESFKNFLEAEGMIVFDNTVYRYCYTPWTLDLAKSRKSTQISEDIQNYFDSTPFAFEGKLFDVDRESRILVTQKAASITATGSTVDVQWRLSDNTTATIPVTDFIRMAAALTEEVEYQYGLSWYRKEQLNTALTYEEVEAI